MLWRHDVISIRETRCQDVGCFIVIVSRRFQLCCVLTCSFNISAPVFFRWVWWAVLCRDRSRISCQFLQHPCPLPLLPLPQNKSHESKKWFSTWGKRPLSLNPLTLWRTADFTFVCPPTKLGKGTQLLHLFVCTAFGWQHFQVYLNNPTVPLEGTLTLTRKRHRLHVTPRYWHLKCSDRANPKWNANFSCYRHLYCHYVVDEPRLHLVWMDLYDVKCLSYLFTRNFAFAFACQMPRMGPMVSNGVFTA